MSRQDRLVSDDGSQRRRRRVIKTDSNGIKGIFENALKRKSPKASSPIKPFRGRPSILPPPLKTPRKAPRVDLSPPKVSPQPMSIQPKDSPHALLMALCELLPTSPLEPEEMIPDTIRESHVTQTPIVPESVRFSGLESPRDNPESSERPSLHALTPQALAGSSDTSNLFNTSFSNIFNQSGMGGSDMIEKAFRERLSTTPSNRSFISDVTESYSNTENLSSFGFSPSAMAVEVEDPLPKSSRGLDSPKQGPPLFKVSEDVSNVSPNQIPDGQGLKEPHNDILSLGDLKVTTLDVSASNPTSAFKGSGISPAQLGEAPTGLPPSDSFNASLNLNEEWVDLMQDKSQPEAPVGKDNLQTDHIPERSDYVNLRPIETANVESSGANHLPTETSTSAQSINITELQHNENIDKLSNSAHLQHNITPDKIDDFANPEADVTAGRLSAIVNPQVEEHFDDFLQDTITHNDTTGKLDDPDLQTNIAGEIINPQHDFTVDKPDLQLEDLNNSSTDFEPLPQKGGLASEIAEREAFGDFDPLSLGSEDMPKQARVGRFPGKRASKAEQHFSILSLNFGRLGLGLKAKSKSTRSSGRNLKSSGGISVPNLPDSLIKGIAEMSLQGSSGGPRLSPEALPCLQRASFLYFQQTSCQLAAYAKHAGRQTIDASDAKLLMKRQGIINHRNSALSVLRSSLPQEFLDLTEFGPGSSKK